VEGVEKWSVGKMEKWNVGMLREVPEHVRITPIPKVTRVPE